MTRIRRCALRSGRIGSTSLNQGVGQYDRRRARLRFDGERLQLHAAGSRPARPPFFMNTRFYGQPSTSRSCAPRSKRRRPRERRVHERRRAAGGRPRSRVSFTLSSDLDYVSGMHSWRAGISLDGYDYRSDEAQNYLGTYTFATLDDVQRRQAAELHAPHRQSAHRLLQHAGRRSIFRTTSGCART